MILLDLAFDIFFFIYTSLGFGTKEHKIETKMKKIKSAHPTAYQLYLKHKTTFETDEVLSNKIVNLNTKDQMSVNATVYEIYAYFKVAS